jgi:hypothetical protein
MKPSDSVKLIGVPPNLRDGGWLGRLYRICVVESRSKAGWEDL